MTDLMDANLNLTLRNACDDYMDFIESEGYTDDGLDDYHVAVFEAAMEAALGVDVWERVQVAEVERAQTGQDERRATERE